jgi:peptide/nickel transport system substrate-binding protein
VKEIKVVNSYTVQFLLSERLMTLPEILTTLSLNLIPKHILGNRNVNEATDFDTKQPIGTGPFKIKRVVEGSYLEFEAFNDFFLGRPKVDGLVFKIVPDLNIQVAQFIPDPFVKTTCTQK